MIYVAFGLSFLGAGCCLAAVGLKKNNISLSELARRIGQTPQNFNKKILRNTISDDELSKILLVLNIEYEQKIRFSDGTSIEMKTD